MTSPVHDDEARRALRRAVRKATLYTYGFLAAALLLALLGAALVAWVFDAAGVAPFLRTWLLLATLLLLVAALAAVVRNWKG